MSMSETRKIARRIVVVFAIVLMIGAAALMALAYYFTGDTIRRGISIENTDVSLLSVNDAQRIISEDISRIYSSGSLTFTYGNRKWDVKLQD
ncbi:MAG: hypothetical protein PHG58_07725, partial [Clostridia bacterium]|nr:hypothetical protein [Clostridia bacterium]